VYSGLHDINITGKEKNNLESILEVMGTVIQDEQSSAIKENEMIMHLGEGKDSTGQHYSKSYIYNEVIKHNKTQAELEENTVFLVMAQKNLHEQSINSEEQEEELVDLESFIEEKINVNIALMRNNDHRKKQVGKMKKQVKGTVQKLATGAVASSIGPAGAAAFAAYGTYKCVKKLGKNIKKTAKTIREYRANEAGYNIKKDVNIFTMSSDEAKLYALNKIKDRNSKKQVKVKKWGIARNVIEGKDYTIYNKIDNTLKSTTALVNNKRRRSLNFLREAKGLKQKRKSNLSIAAAYNEVKKEIMQTNEFSEAKELFKKIDKLERFEEKYSTGHPKATAKKVKKRRHTWVSGTKSGTKSKSHTESKNNKSSPTPKARRKTM
jgi:hypothetical protein